MAKMEDTSKCCFEELMLLKEKYCSEELKSLSNLLKNFIQVIKKICQVIKNEKE